MLDKCKSADETAKVSAAAAAAAASNFTNLREYAEYKGVCYLVVAAASTWGSTFVSLAAGKHS